MIYILKLMAVFIKMLILPSTGLIFYDLASRGKRIHEPHHFFALINDLLTTDHALHPGFGIYRYEAVS